MARQPRVPGRHPGARRRLPGTGTTQPSAQWALGLGLSLGALVTLTLVLSTVVIGPLLGGGRQIAERLGQDQTFETLWVLVRWPAVGLVGVAFLVVLYRYGPNVVNTWRDTLPGAVLGMLALVGVAVVLRTYLSVAGPAAPELGRPGEAVSVAAQTLGAALAVILWLWLSSIVVLTGGVVNAELQRMRAESEPDAGADI